MSHARKKGGERKDKKTSRMREAQEFKHGMSAPPRPSTDQWDVQVHKPGAPSDKMSPQNRLRPAKKKT